MAFNADIRHFTTANALGAYLASLSPFRGVLGSTIHNTYIPDEAAWRGMASMRSMIQTYVGKGWTAGPHLFLCVGSSNPDWDGIWQMTPLTGRGVHAGDCNTVRFGIEVVGNFQTRPWSAGQRALILDTLETIHRWANLGPNIVGHRDCMPGRTCPGQKAYEALPALRTDLSRRLRQMPILHTQTTYRVHEPKGANVRAQPTTVGAIIAKLPFDARFVGHETEGTPPPGQRDTRWVERQEGGYVWRLLLDVLPYTEEQS